MAVGKIKLAETEHEGLSHENIEDIGEEVLPETPLADGFTYLFRMLSHLVSVERSYKHKLESLFIISSITDKASYTREDLEIALSKYQNNRIGHLLSGLINGGWLEFDDGRYRLTKGALKFLRILPVLNSGSSRDEEAALDILYAAMDMVEHAQSPVVMKTLLRDQAIQQLLRDEEHLKTALESKNPRMMEQVANLARQHLEDIRILKNRQREMYKLVPDRKKSREIYTAIQRVIDLYNLVTFEYKNMIEDSIKTGGRTFTKHDADQFLYKTEFNQLEEMLAKGVVFAPVTMQVLHVENLLPMSEQFLQLNRSRKLQGYGQDEGNLTKEDPQEATLASVDLVKKGLQEAFNQSGNLPLKEFAVRDTWVDTLLYLATLAFLEGENQQLRKHYQPEVDFVLNISPEGEELEGLAVKELSRGEITRRDF